jgi:hypothetical protein
MFYVSALDLLLFLYSAAKLIIRLMMPSIQTTNFSPSRSRNLVSFFKTLLFSSDSYLIAALLFREKMISTYFSGIMVFLLVEF